MGVEPQFSPYLAGANWLLQLAKLNRGLSASKLLELLSEKVDEIRRNPGYSPDEGRLAVSVAVRAAHIKRAMTQVRHTLKSQR